MKALFIIVVLGLVSIISGCEGICTVNPIYQPTGTLVCITEGQPVIKVEILDEREQKVFHHSPGFGYITDDGRGGPFRLIRPTKEIVEQAFSQALEACNYDIRHNIETIYQVRIEKFLVIIHPPDDPIFGIGGEMEASVALSIEVIGSGKILAAKTIVQTERGKLLSNTPDELLSRSLSIAVERSVQDTYLAGVINDEHRRLWTQWEKALNASTITALQDFIEKNPDGFYANKARAKIVDLEVDEIMSRNPEKLPPLKEAEHIRGRKYSVINIHNATNYNLTLRYSGPDSFKVIFVPGERSSVEVLNGDYRVAATVNAFKVDDYAGEENLTGANYQVKYYIIRKTIPSIFTPPEPLTVPKFVSGSLSKFSPWPAKRKLPPHRLQSSSE